jgi:hypothetical protein
MAVSETVKQIERTRQAELRTKPVVDLLNLLHTQFCAASIRRAHSTTVLGFQDAVFYVAFGKVKKFLITSDVEYIKLQVKLLRDDEEIFFKFYRR